MNIYQFMDSMAHLSAGLDSLTASLIGSDCNYGILKQSIIVRDPQTGKVSDERMDYIKKKLAFPYEKLTSIQAMKDLKSWPDMDNFYSSLSEDINITKEEYEHGRLVFEKFGCADMCDYLELYVHVDTLLLAEVLQAYRRKILEFGGLDAMWYLSAPGLSLDLALKLTSSKMELLEDQSLFELIESNIRGGLR